MELNIQMFADGKIVIDTKVNTKSFEDGLKKMKKTSKETGTSIKNIFAGVGLAKIVGVAMGQISSSIDGAVKRVDTLNNFPKVMSNLGISAKDSSKSIEKMSDKLSGLPTTLDEGAMAVQRFTSANGDVKKSTDIFLALNNALLAGGAAADIQSTALEQISQSYAKGKPDMMEWRSLMTAMPAQLTQVAKAMGYVSATDLGEAVREKGGEKEFRRMIDTIVELNTKGVGNFQSFEKQARNSTEGIGTAIKVAKTQVVKGVADLIKGINDGLESANLPSVSEIITSIGKSSKKTLDAIAEKLPDIIKYLKEMAPAIITVVGAIAIYKTTVEAIKVAKFTQSIFGTVSAFVKLIPSIKSAKDAFMLFNMVLNLNPIGLIVTSIGLLIGAFIYLWNTSENFRDFWIGMWGAITETIDNVVKGIVNFFTETIPEAFNNFISFLSSLKDNIVKFFTETIPEAFNNFVDFIGDFIKNVIKFFSDLPYYIGFVIGLIIGYFIKFTASLSVFLTTEIPKFINGIIDWFVKLPGKIWEAILAILNKLGEWGAKLIDFAKTEIPKFINNVIQFFKELPGKIWFWLLEVIAKVLNWLKDMKDKAVKGIKEVADKIIKGFKELPEKVKDIGKDIVEGLWKGINGAKDWVVDKVKSFAKGIVDGMKKALGIHSPSKVFKEEVGKFIAQGVGVGFEDELDNVYSKMQKAIDLETGKMTANVKTSGTYQMAMAGVPIFNLLDNSENTTQLVVNGKILAEVVNTENRNREVAKA